jgi:diguanylate cyclase (GGDEF)-like protein
LVAATPIQLGLLAQSVRITISAGLASFPDDGDDAVELLAAADERMFRAKRQGRNLVVARPEAVLSC